MSIEISVKDAESRHWDLVVIGSGTAGADAAIRAAQLGFNNILIIEKNRNRVGGTCLNIGCVPTKKLIHLTDTYHMLKTKLNEEGIISQPKFDFKAALESTKSLVSKIVGWYAFRIFPSYDIKLLIGEARLKSSNEVKVNDSIIKAKNILIATGSSPRIRPIRGIEEGFKSGFVITSDDFLDLDSLPSKVLIIGGGYIGIELATMFRKAGSEVMIIKSSNKFLPALDPEIGEALPKYLKNIGVEVRFSTSVTKIDPENKRVTLSNGEVINDVDKVIIASGREPNIHGLNLEGVGVEVKDGAIVVDEHMRTSIPNIYAAGDVTGKYMLASVAKVQGIVAAENMAGLNSKIDYSVVPITVFSDPEIASVGVSARGDDPNYIVVKMPNIANYRVIAYKPHGWVKIVAERRSRKLVGVHMIAPFATEIINMAVIAIRKGLTIDEIKEWVFPHPVFSELLVDAMELAIGANMYLPKSL
jgi:dihydrolipoamide dehydrogenase